MHTEPASINVSSDSSSESSDEESDSDSDTSDPYTSPKRTDPRFIEYLIKIARKHAKKTKDTATFTNFLALLPIGKAAKRRSEETLADLAKNFKKTAPSYLCVECDEPFADKENLKKHLVTCNKEEPNKTPDAAEKTFPCDKCSKRYLRKANLERHIQNKHAVSARASDGPNETKSKNNKCRLCKDIRVNIYQHYAGKHKIDNVEQMLFDDGTVLVLSDIDPDNGNAQWFKEQLQKALYRYIDPTCRLCEVHVQFDTTDLLKKHYTVHHNVDAKYLSNVEHMFRAEMKAHLGETDPKSKRADTKVSVSDKKKVIIKEKRQNKDNTRFIYKCKCGKAIKSYDASVEHSQEHLVAKYTKTELGYTRNFAFEADIDENNVLKVIEYDFETLLTDAWFDMFDDAASDKDRILSSSIYKHSRSVKLRSKDTDSSNGIPAYQCEMCQLFVHPAKIETHCKNYKICPENQPEKYYCNICDVHFYSEPALAYHKENHAAGFKLVTFNSKSDVQINKILGKLRNRPSDDSQEEEETEKKTKKNADGKQIEIISVKQYCKERGEYVDVSTIEAHSAAHQIEREKYSGNVSDDNVSTESVVVNNKSTTREVTEELTHANQVDDGKLSEDGDIPVNVNSKENDAKYTDESDSNSDFCQSPKHSIHVVQVQVHTNMSVDENATDVENVGSPEEHLREMFSANNSSQASMSHNEELQSTQELQQILGNDDTENGNHEGRDKVTKVSQDIFSEDMTQDQNEGSAEASITNHEVETDNEEADTIQVENEEGIIRKSSKEIINELIPDDDMELDRDDFKKLNELISMKLFSRD